MGKYEIQTLSVDELESVIRKVFSEFKKEFENKPVDTVIKLLSRKDTADLFGVDISTINNWTKKGILIPIIIEGRRFFSYQDIQELIERSRIRKH